MYTYTSKKDYYMHGMHICEATPRINVSITIKIPVNNDNVFQERSS
jgi:hypothetical protein